MNNNYPEVGALPAAEDKCVFTVWAPQCKKVELVIGHDIHSLTRSEFGYWTIRIENVQVGIRYMFQLDGEKKLPDPASRWQPAGVHEASAVADTNFGWTDDSWAGIPLGEMIIYELHVGTFSPEGTFAGVIKKLDYLKELGINTIELMPVAQFPGDRNWGYDGVYPFAVHHDYGGPIGLMELVNEAHSREIAVLLDVVYNHQGPEGNYLTDYGPYFTDKYKTGWGKAINFDDAWCDGVRHFYWQNALMWLTTFRIDGLRLDAVHAIWDFGARHFVEVLASKTEQIQKASGRKKVLIAEFDLNNPRYITAPSKGGYGLSGQWVDEFHHALHSLVTGETNGYYEDFGDVEHLLRSLRDSYVYTGQYSKHRKKHFGVLPESNPYSQFVVFAQNHDQIGNRKLGDRLTAKLSFEALKLVAATLLLSPHVPMLFMGEEYGEKNPFQYFISHTDEELVKMVQEGRKKEFSYFTWEGDIPDPQAEETFRHCKLSWTHLAGEHAVLLSFYTFLISFRKQRIAMKGFERKHVRVFQIPDRKIIGMERTFESDYILIFFNFEKNVAQFSYQDVIGLKMFFDSSAAHWKPDRKDVPTLSRTDNSVVMGPESVIIFES
jgi:maltooligosyltrehalose trehalohydrolase